MNPKIDAFARSQNHASARVNVSVYVCMLQVRIRVARHLTELKSA